MVKKNTKSGDYCLKMSFRQESSTLPIRSQSNDQEDAGVDHSGLIVQQLNIERPTTMLNGPKKSFYLDINEDSDNSSTSGFDSLDPVYYSISSVSAKDSWIINDALESDIEEFIEIGSGYTTPEKQVTPPVPRRPTNSVSTFKISH